MISSEAQRDRDLPRVTEQAGPHQCVAVTPGLPPDGIGCGICPSSSGLLRGESGNMSAEVPPAQNARLLRGSGSLGLGLCCSHLSYKWSQ